MKITVPSKLEVAGSGDLKSVRKHAGKETWRWVQPYQQATYLAMISISDYDVYHSTHDDNDRTQVADLELHRAEARDQAAERALIPKIDPLSRSVGSDRTRSTVPESWSRRPESGTPSRRRTGQSSTAVPDDLTNVHEWAHQWYGNSVSLSDWGDIWLNEGFATYAEWLWAASHGGPSTAEQFQQAYDDTRRSSTYGRRRRQSSTDPADLFGAAGLPRGAHDARRRSGRRSDRTTSSSSCASGHSSTNTATSRRHSSSLSPSGCRARTWMRCSTLGSYVAEKPALS